MISTLLSLLLGSLLVFIAAFAVTVLIVYLIRRMPVGYSWTIAMVAGAMANVAILLTGDLIYDVNLSAGNVLLGSLLALVAAKVIEFFRFCVDYGRTERVQFEDDEYYYYVKAVPKMAVAMSTKTVKRINSQREREIAAAARGGSPRQGERPAGRPVTTERPAGRNTAQPRQQARPQTRNPERRGGRSVTIGSAVSTDTPDDSGNDYGEWL